MKTNKPNKLDSMEKKIEDSIEPKNPPVSLLTPSIKRQLMSAAGQALKERGGSRAGAGRKPSGHVPLLIRLKPELIAKIRAKAKREGVTISDAVTRLIEV